MSFKRGFDIETAALLLLIAAVFSVWPIFSAFEASAYRRHCNTPVTTWDAMFLELRIDECKCP